MAKLEGDMSELIRDSKQVRLDLKILARNLMFAEDIKAYVICDKDPDLSHEVNVILCLRRGSEGSVKESGNDSWVVPIHQTFHLRGLRLRGLCCKNDKVVNYLVMAHDRRRNKINLCLEIGGKKLAHLVLDVPKIRLFQPTG